MFNFLAKQKVLVHCIGPNSQFKRDVQNIFLFPFQLLTHNILALSLSVFLYYLQLSSTHILSREVGVEEDIRDLKEKDPFSQMT